MVRALLLNGVERRRVWPDELRQEIVFEAFRPGAIVSEVARRYEVSTGQIYTWRKELMSSVASPGFVEAVVAPISQVGNEASLGSGADISVDMPCGARVRIPSGTSAELVTATLRALR